MIKPEKILVSACLYGDKCRYDGDSCYDIELEKLKRDYDIVPVCPEQLGGLSTPRPPAEINEGDGEDVLTGKSNVLIVQSGEDVSSEFLSGARETLKIAQNRNIKKAYLKSNSPSCGCGKIYINGKLASGDGVTTALLKQNGIKVFPLEGKRDE